MKRFILVIALALHLSGCGGPSKEYLADADAILKQMEAINSFLSEGGDMPGGIPAARYSERYATEFLQNEGGLRDKVREFEAKFDAKDEGKFESFKQILELNELYWELNKPIIRALPESVPAEMSSACGKTIPATEKARRFLAEGK